jgi:molecular chaperone GrpE
MTEPNDSAGAAEATGTAGVDQPEPVVPAPEQAPETGQAAGPPPDRAAQLEAELAELKDRHLRLAAEYDNFRKRTLRERDEGRLRGQADLARRLLEALDDLGRVAHLDPVATAAADVIAGVELVERKILRELEAVGLVAISAVNVPFDPQLHEAIATIPTAQQDEDHTVAAVFQVGYRLNGTLLRPARVQVRLFTAAD